MVLVPANVSEWIHQAIAAVDPSGRTIHQEARRYGGIALMGTICCIWLLRPDGSLWQVDEDCGVPLEPLEPRFHLMAVATGVEHYPWLEAMLPRRPIDALICPVCDGAGNFLPQGVSPDSSGVLCERCQCLGWLHADGSSAVLQVRDS